MNAQGRANMDIKSYINICVLDEHAYKSFSNGYSLDVADIPKHDLQSFLDFLFDNDPATRELVLDRMQSLIDQQLPVYECKDRYGKGYVPHVDQINGEVTWHARGN